MLSQEEHVEVMALAGRGWTISAIARHTGLNRRTVRAYVRSARQPGQRRRFQADLFAPFERYVGQRLRDDPHLWATVLYDEVRALGYRRSYQRFTAELRGRSLRPVCADCLSARSRVTTEIPHEPGEELQWDWVELPDAPWGGKAHLLQASLSHSTKFRGALAESEEQPYLAEAIDKVVRRFGGTARRWRIDRMSTAVDPKTGDLLPWFAALARHYGVSVSGLSALPRPPQGEGRKHQPLCRSALVADGRGRELGAGSTRLRPLLRRDRRRPPPRQPDGRRSGG